MLALIFDLSPSETLLLGHPGELIEERGAYSNIPTKQGLKCFFGVLLLCSWYLSSECHHHARPHSRTLVHIRHWTTRRGNYFPPKTSIPRT